MPDYEAIKDMIDAIQDRGRDMTPWESEFISSVISQYKMKGWLSSTQITIITRIYRERTVDGARERPASTVLSKSQARTERFRNEGREDFTGRSGRERLAREKGYDE